MALFETTNLRLASNAESYKFKEARILELQGLIDNGTFKVVKRDTLPTRKRIYGTRFIDTYKTVDNNEKLKSGLVAQKYIDDDADRIATKSPTVQQESQRIMGSSAAWNTHHKPYNRDMTQADTQAKYVLELTINLEAP